MAQNAHDTDSLLRRNECRLMLALIVLETALLAESALGHGSALWASATGLVAYLPAAWSIVDGVPQAMVGVALYQMVIRARERRAAEVSAPPAP